MTNYEKLTKAELLALCKERNLKEERGMKKQELVKLLESNDKVSAKKSKADTKKKSSETASTLEATLAESEAIAMAVNPSELTEAEIPQSPEKPKAMPEEIMPGEEVLIKTNKDDLSQRDKISKKDLNKENRIRPKSKEKRFRASKEMLTIDADDRFKKSGLINKADEELMLSFSDPAMNLMGRVIGVTSPKRVKISGKMKAVVYAIVKYKNRKVYILSDLFFPNAEEIPEDKLLQYMQMRIGSEVDFNIIGKVQEDAEPLPTYYGSRLVAMERKRERYWYSKKSNKATDYLINSGDNHEARIVAVHKRGIFVEMFGVETKIQLSDLAYEYLVDARPSFFTGDKIAVKVTDIKRAADEAAPTYGYPIEFSGSVKACFPDPRILHFVDYNKNDTYTGIVTKKQLGKKAPGYFVNIEGEVDVFCTMKPGVTMLPEEGDTVSVHIKDKDPKNLFLWGNIIHVFPNRRP